MERIRLMRLGALMLLAGGLCAQLNRGSLTGTLADQTGAVIPAVKITIRNTATGATYETESNASGQYHMPKKWCPWTRPRRWEPAFPTGS